MPYNPAFGHGAGGEQASSTPPTGPGGGPGRPRPDAHRRASARIEPSHNEPPENGPSQSSANSEAWIRPDGKGRPKSLRALAAAGLLAQAAGAHGNTRATLESEAYALVWPIVFNRLTRELEFKRGHRACTRSVHGLAPECLDRFQDDVAAVIDYLLRYANSPIRDLESWIASRLAAATVDGHRRDRGRRGAAQRPRVPKWLAARLDGDPWLVELSLSILTWVGVPSAVGGGLWPLDAWRLHRAEVLGDWTGEPGAIERDVETVLTAMRTRAAWFQKFVDRPLGAKQAPVYSGPPPGTGTARALVLVDEQEGDEAKLMALAGLAVDELTRRLAAGEEPRTCIADVVRRVFAEADPASELNRTPHAGFGYQDRVEALLADPAETQRVAAAILQIVAPAATAVAPAA